MPDPLGARLACVCIPLGQAVVIGSAQPASDFDGERLAAAGADLVRRRSGGGAVLVAPGLQVWLDVFVPNDDPLAQSDVGKSFHWLGDAFAAAIASVLGTSAAQVGVEVNRGPRQSTPWSPTLCYAGLGAGEVTVAGRKVVGMSQRRERSGAWIHSMALLTDRAGDLADLLAGPAERRSAARAGLERAGLPDAEHLVDPLAEEILGRLP
ncbi:MAG: lipoyl protein ligase domain-containing protein [Acidimicrobiales bacterium]